jgi:hypothetical protein
MVFRKKKLVLIRSNMKKSAGVCGFGVDHRVSLIYGVVVGMSEASFVRLGGYNGPVYEEIGY